MFITPSMLRDRGACVGQIDRFRALFPEGVEVTPELCVKYAQEFEFDWAADRLLTPAQLAEYDRICDAAWADNGRIVAPARAKYNRIYDEARAKYKRIRDATHQEEYDRICAAARSEYNRIRDAEREKYKRTCAAAFTIATTI